jgi:hypothetical protein
VSDYRLDDWVTGVWCLAEEKDFPPSFCVQTSSEAQSASYPVGTGDRFPRGKAPAGCDADHSLPFSAEIKNE